MKTKIITSIYSDLHGSDLGGRPSRGGHYRYSLRTLLKMTDADFVCYTSESELEGLQQFFYVENGISDKKLIFKTFDLRNFILTEKINKINSNHLFCENIAQKKWSRRVLNPRPWRH